MAIMKERCFPRGGKKPITHSSKNKKVHLFDTRRKKKKESKVKKSKTERNETTEKITAESLTYLSITDGMLVLGCIFGIADTHLRLTLPGRLIGNVVISNISRPYTKLLKNLLDKKSEVENYSDLKHMFKIGQFVVAKVIAVSTLPDNGRHKIDLTLDPGAVNTNYTHSSIKTGMVLHGAVKSVEDHGYTIDFGIDSLRAFLNTKNARKFINQWNDGRPLGVGQVLPCLIKKVDSTPTSSVVQVTADPSLTSSSVAELNQEYNIHTLIPGTLVKSLLVENVKDGCLAEFLNFKGIIHRDHLGDPPPALASLEYARVLYTIPLLNTVYMSILLGSKDLLTVSRVEEKGVPSLGKIIKNATVISASKRGLIVTLGKYTKCKGFVGRKRLKDGDEHLPENVKRSYPIGAQISVRIIGKDIIENIYICSAQTSVMEEEIYSISDLKVGMKVTGTVLKLIEKGLDVKLGKASGLKGFVPTSHFADFPVNHPEKRFIQGKKVTGRVMRINTEKGDILLTLKPSLVDSELAAISSYDQAADTTFVDGTIVKIFDKGLIVAFFGDVKGLVSLSEAGTSSTDPNSLKESFYHGQTVRCRIISCYPRKEKLLLSLRLHGDGSEKYFPREIVSRIGHSFRLRIKKVEEDGLSVVVICSEDRSDLVLKGKKGKVPVMHLSDHASLTKCLLKTYKSGAEIASAVLHSVRPSDDEQPLLLFSLRPSVIEFCSSCNRKQSDPEKEESEMSDDEENGNINTVSTTIPKVKVYNGSVLPCSVVEVNDDGLLLEAPVPKFGRSIFVPKECAADEIPNKLEELGLIKEQLLFGKVLEMNFRKKKLTVATMLSEMWDGYDVEPSVEYVKSYMNDLHHIQKHWKLISEIPLGRFVEGQMVKGTVVSLSDSEAVISVNKIKGKKLQISPPINASVIRHHYKSKPIKVGDVVTGRVIFVDYPDEKLHLTLNPKTIEELERIAGEALPVGKGIRLEILLSNKHVTIGFVKGNLHHGEYVYLPTKCHHNDFISLPSSETSLKPGEVHKVIISGKVNEKMIGVKKKYVNMYVNHQKKVMNRKRKHSLSIENRQQADKGEELPSQGNKKRKLDKDFSEEVEESAKEPTKRKLNKKEGKKENDIETSVEERHNDRSSLKKISSEKKSVSNKEQNIVQRDVNGPENHENEESNCESEGVGEEMEEVNDDSDSLAKKKIVSEAKNPEEELSSWYKLPRLKDTIGFVWDLDITNYAQALPKKKVVDESSSDEEEPKEESDGKKKKGKKKLNVAMKAEEEARLREAEERLLDSTTSPETADDFDRLVLSSPDSSLIWMKYVAFHLQNTEIEKARSVAHRALKTINFREEQERLNVWVCLLNLENLYGTKESLEKVFQDAQQMNDTFKVYCQMCQIYQETKKMEEMENLINVMLKKFRDNKDAWVHAGTMFMKSSNAEKAGEVLRRALKSLPQRDHVDVISRWAQLEARSECGSVDRAQSLLEGVLAACPKRTDIWSSLTDTLVKAGRIEDARNIMERAVSQKLPARKMKVLFKKYLAFEEANGTAENVARVRQLAIDYVEKGMTEAS